MLNRISPQIIAEYYLRKPAKRATQATEEKSEEKGKEEKLVDDE